MPNAGRTKCIRCGNTTVREKARPGRYASYLQLTVEIPAEVPIPECSRCHHVDLSCTGPIGDALRRSYLAALKELAQQALRSLHGQVSQRQLELLVGLSQGYLSRVKSGTGQPSAALVGLLGLLAEDPNRLVSLRNIWAAPPPIPVPLNRDRAAVASAKLRHREKADVARAPLGSALRCSQEDGD